MVKKELNPINIDYENCIIEKSLLQVKNVLRDNYPDLINVWTIDIIPRDSGAVIDFIRKCLQKDDPIAFSQIKRVKKVQEGNLLRIILCSVSLFDEMSSSSLEKLISEYNKRIIDVEQGNSAAITNDAQNTSAIKAKKKPNRNFAYENLSCSNKVPMNLPPTKDIMLEWTEKYWPLTWCGNPNDQILNDMKFDMDVIKNNLDHISGISKKLAQENENILPVVTSFVNPLDSNDIITTVDSREKTNPLDHSIMCGIKSVSEAEIIRRSQNKEIDVSYLCLNFDVYTTHEPCSMCSMALIHSRIKRLIFINPMKQTGCLRPDSGGGYCMQDCKNLNSKYEVFQWIGDGYQDVPDVPKDICC